jgi:hypothetical protein
MPDPKYYNLVKKFDLINYYAGVLLVDTSARTNCTVEEYPESIE